MTPASPHAAAADPDTLRQAADWFALLGSHTATLQDQQHWQAWLRASPSHQAAWARVEAINGRFQPLTGSDALRQTSGQALQGRAKRQHQRRAVLRGLAVLGSAGLMGLAAGRTPPGRRFLAGLEADFQTATGEIRPLTLPDDSRLWLNTASAIRLEYDTHVRRIVLLYGQILVDTAADPDRPLIVQTRYGTLRALGTRFDVRQIDEGVRVAVYQGAVELQLSPDSDTPGRTQIVPAGGRLNFARGMGQASATLEPGGDSWTRHLLMADDQPLGIIIRTLARYRRGRLACDPAIAHLRVTGSFPLDDTDRALAMLTTALPVEIDAPLQWWVTLRPR